MSRLLALVWAAATAAVVCEEERGEDLEFCGFGELLLLQTDLHLGSELLLQGTIVKHASGPSSTRRSSTISVTAVADELGVRPGRAASPWRGAPRAGSRVGDHRLALEPALFQRLTGFVDSADSESEPWLSEGYVLVAALFGCTFAIALSCCCFCLTRGIVMPFKNPLHEQRAGPASSFVGVSGGQTYFMTVVAGPPPICPSFILPNTQARFKIPMAVLSNSVGEIDVLGTSGRKLLHISLEDRDGLRWLSLSSVGQEATPRCKVSTKLPTSIGEGMTPQEFEVYDRESQHYGTLERTFASLDGNGGSGGLLRYAGEPFDGAGVMSIVAQPNTNRADMALKAQAMDGHPLASAGRGGQGMWNLWVEQGSDAVLICCCMLALLLLRPKPMQAKASEEAVGPATTTRPPPEEERQGHDGRAGGAEAGAGMAAGPAAGSDSKEDGEPSPQKAAVSAVAG